MALVGCVNGSASKIGNIVMSRLKFHFIKGRMYELGFEYIWGSEMVSKGYYLYCGREEEQFLFYGNEEVLKLRRVNSKIFFGKEGQKIICIREVDNGQEF